MAIEPNVKPVVKTVCSPATHATPASARPASLPPMSSGIPAFMTHVDEDLGIYQVTLSYPYPNTPGPRKMLVKAYSFEKVEAQVKVFIEKVAHAGYPTPELKSIRLVGACVLLDIY